jgi:hypothetical protein
MRGGRLGGGATVLSDLDDDAMGVARVQEGLLPVRIGQVDPDGLDARRLYQGQRVLDVGDEEVEVVRARAAASQEAVEEGRAGAPGGCQQLDFRTWRISAGPTSTRASCRHRPRFRRGRRRLAPSHQKGRRADGQMIEDCVMRSHVTANSIQSRAGRHDQPSRRRRPNRDDCPCVPRRAPRAGRADYPNLRRDPAGRRCIAPASDRRFARNLDVTISDIRLLFCPAGRRLVTGGSGSAGDRGGRALGLLAGAARPELDPGQDGNGHEQPGEEQDVDGKAEDGQDDDGDEDNGDDSGHVIGRRPGQAVCGSGG